MFLDIDGNKVFTLSFGKGPRTFLAHSGWVGNFEDWIATLAPLSETRRTVVYDHRGTGETSVPVEKITACNIETMRYIESLIPGSKLVVFEGSGHLPAMIRPMDVAAAIKDYFGA